MADQEVAVTLDAEMESQIGTLTVAWGLPREEVIRLLLGMALDNAIFKMALDVGDG